MEQGEKLKQRKKSQQPRRKTDVGLEQDGGSGGGDKWSDSGYILKKQLIRFPDTIKMKCMKSRVKDHPQVHGTKTGRKNCGYLQVGNTASEGSEERWGSSDFRLVDLD